MQEELEEEKALIIEEAFEVVPIQTDKTILKSITEDKSEKTKSSALRAQSVYLLILMKWIIVSWELKHVMLPKDVIVLSYIQLVL